MKKSSKNWSKRRRIMARRIASVLYGVISIVTVDLALDPSELHYVDAISGTVLVGLAMTMTRMFVGVVTNESETGAHLAMREYGAIANDSLLVMLFPLVIALLIAGAAMVTALWAVLLDIILYIGMAAVFVISFSSSYILDRAFKPALLRALVWLLLTLLLVAIKKMG